MQLCCALAQHGLRTTALKRARVGQTWKDPSMGQCFYLGLHSSMFLERLGQKSCRAKVPRIFRIFVPDFLPNFPRKFPEFFVLYFSGNGDHKKSPNIPAIFQCQIPRQTQKNIYKVFLELRQSNERAVLCWKRFKGQND